MTKLRPEGFRNPYPAYSSVTESVLAEAILVQFGVQHPDPAVADELARLLRSALAEHGPVTQLESGSHLDDAGFANHVVLAYWSSPDEAEAWTGSEAFAEWDAAAAARGAGRWRESLRVPPRRFETSYSTDTVEWGLAKNLEKELNRYHSYFGSMRDRIPDAEDAGLPATVAVPTRRPSAEDTVSGRVDIPENFCFIRSPQGWQHCPPAEKDWFEQRVLPVYLEGVDFLTRHPEETGCLSMRKIDTAGQSQVQSSSLAWWVSLAHLEQWAHQHPTHLAILRGFGELAQEFGPDVSVFLGHEVYVVGAGAAWAEYTDCHPGTGLLPYLAASAPSS